MNLTRPAAMLRSNRHLRAPRTLLLAAACAAMVALLASTVPVLGAAPGEDGGIAALATPAATATARVTPRPTTPARVTPTRTSNPTEEIGGVPYDPERDRGCADCGPNGTSETAKERVYRWAGDCQQSSQPACATEEGAVADSVERLYSEYTCSELDWADSGFTAEPPGWAASRHNRPELFASQTCGGSGTAGGGGTSGGSTASGIAQGILAGLDFRRILTLVIEALWKLVIGDGIEAIGNEIAAFLLATPNLLSNEGSMANVQGVVDALRLAAIGACLIIFTFTVAQFTAGREEAPQAALGRLLAVMVALGFYRTFVGWLLRGANELAFGIQAIGSDNTTGVFNAALAALVPAALPFWYILSIVGGGLVIAVGVVKILGLAFLLLTYAAGPLLLPLAIHPRTAGWVGLWAEHLVKALLWPVLWALQFRLFGAIAGGLTFVDAQGNLDLGTGALGALTSLAMLVIMAGTPWTLHTRFTVARYGGFVVRQAGRAVDAAVLVATGGASASVKGAAALALRQRATSRAASSREAQSGD